MWKSLVRRIDFLYISGKHLELREEGRAKICGSMMMTTAAMKYLSTFSTLNIQAVRTRPRNDWWSRLSKGLSSPSC